MYLESYFDLNALKMIVKIKFDVNYVKLDLIRTFNFNNTLHYRDLVRAGATGAWAPVKIEQRVPGTRPQKRF